VGEPLLQCRELGVFSRAENSRLPGHCNAACANNFFGANVIEGRAADRKIPMIVILADDLTSALDGAAPFVQRGLSATVLLDEKALAEQDTDVVAVDLDTRSMAPSKAEILFERVSRRVPSGTLIYKTVDSTLRGNMESEIRATLRGSGRTHAVVAPAFPSAGRTTLHGHQFVNGVPLEQTTFAKDPRNPVQTGRVADRLAGLHATQFAVYDASRDENFDALVTQVNWDPTVLWVGSPGLASALARAMARQLEQHKLRVVRTALAARILVAVGSLHDANRGQLECLTAAGARVVVLEPRWHPESLGALLDEISRSFASASVVALTSPRELIGDADAAGALVSGRLAEVVKCSRSEFQGLVLTGGDTARRVVDALGTQRLDLTGEVEPGVPCGVLHCADGVRTCATKAGGFGSSTTLLRCVERVRAGTP
jgi:uncharacterized protein YgbK (DUF1537 family)